MICANLVLPRRQGDEAAKCNGAVKTPTYELKSLLSALPLALRQVAPPATMGLAKIEVTAKGQRICQMTETLQEEDHVAQQRR